MTMRSELRLATPRRSRILMIDGSEESAKKVLRWVSLGSISRWFDSGVTVVSAKTAGAAVGILNRDDALTYDGIIMSHDMCSYGRSERSPTVSVVNLVNAITKSTDEDTQILVYSVQTEKSSHSVDALSSAGFNVTRKVWGKKMNFGDFAEWMTLLVSDTAKYRGEARDT